MVGAGILAHRSDPISVALIALGAGMFFIGMVLPTLSEFQVGPGGFSAKLRKRDEEIRASLGPEAQDLTRLGTWLTGSPEAGKELVEQALVETYMRWPREGSKDPAEAVRTRLVELAPPPANAPADDGTADEDRKGGTGDLLSKLLSLPVSERSAIVLNLIEGMDVGAVASVTRREPAAVAADIDRAASGLLAYGAGTGGAT
jgi:hypothetical protein